MSYLTPAELIARFDQSEHDAVLADLSVAEQTAKVAAAIEDAEGVVNSYLSRRYSLPVATTALLKRLVADIARFHLYEDIASQEVRERYDDQLSFLKDIAAGRADLAGADAEGDVDAQGSGCVLVGGGATAMDFSGY